MALKMAEDRLHQEGLVEENKFENESLPEGDGSGKQGDFYGVGKAYGNNGSVVMGTVRMSTAIERDQADVANDVRQVGRAGRSGGRPDGQRPGQGAEDPGAQEASQAGIRGGSESEASTAGGERPLWRELRGTVPSGAGELAVRGSEDVETRQSDRETGLRSATGAVRDAAHLAVRPDLQGRGT